MAVVWAISAWLANVEESQKMERPVWAMKDNTMTAMIINEKLRDAPVFLIFTSGIDERHRITGLAEMLSIPDHDNTGRRWIFRGPWDQQPVFPIRWIVKPDFLGHPYPGVEGFTGVFPELRLPKTLKYLANMNEEQRPTIAAIRPALQLT